ncbi:MULTISPECIES: hypothetical protein [unclassified Pseudodesulfovibrio]|uniref:hypothetical protein n=1 Tax=unclassified Pseudodesulfovibrio TaxID=2661612 RepID=UPI000FEC14BF|nr:MULTISPECIES: hypothetical protein [unclassified Pseudodesulfovibrio]MCJ2165607.1 hypothetical protein [Pseudodesulfovibrio sp. S3-i]RWU03015.1 hypothetical protein DWB63_13280 [Pseudodesulfovibrio sp. S3]
MGKSKPDRSDALEEERKARAEEKLREEAEERRRDREKVLESRKLEEKSRQEGTLSGSAASLVDGPEVSSMALKRKLGE